jgi:APA family basic amino acid/polyamine antiporter
VPGQIDLMAAVYSLAATFAFATAHVSVMRLRFVEPHLRRPFRMPINIPFGRSAIPVLSVIGALGIGAVFTQLIFQNIQNSTFIFLGWLATGVLTFVVYRRARSRSIWQPLATPPPEPNSAEARMARERASADPYTTRVHTGRRRPKRPG